MPSIASRCESFHRAPSEVGRPTLRIRPCGLERSVLLLQSIRVTIRSPPLAIVHAAPCEPRAPDATGRDDERARTLASPLTPVGVARDPIATLSLRLRRRTRTPPPAV